MMRAQWLWHEQNVSKHACYRDSRECERSSFIVFFIIPSVNSIVFSTFSSVACKRLISAFSLCVIFSIGQGGHSIK